MRIFKKRAKYVDKMEELLDTISEITRDLDEEAFDSLIDAVKAMFKVRQKLKGVKTNEEKENDDINEAERILTIESEKKEKK